MSDRMNRLEGPARETLMKLPRDKVRAIESQNHASGHGAMEEVSMKKSERFTWHRLALAGLAWLALPGLAQAGPTYFGVEIADGIPTTYQAPPVALESIAGSPQEPGYHLQQTFATGFLAGVAATSTSGSVSSSGWDLYGEQFGTASAAASGYAQIGRLGGAAHLSASSTDTSPILGPGYTNHAEARFSLIAQDDLLLTSATLASGTLVNVRFTLTLNSQVTELGDAAVGAGGVNARLYFNDEGGPPMSLSILDTDAGAPALRTVTQTLPLRVGSTYRLFQSLDVFAMGNAWYTGIGPSPTPTSWSLDIQADHTAYGFADVLGDASFITASGHDYAFASQVPMPHSGALALAGIALMAFVSRRRAARRDSLRRGPDVPESWPH